MIDIQAMSVRRGQRTVLADVSFRAGPGHCLAVVGPNGSGKSSLLAALSGDLAHSGSATIAGQPVQGAHQARIRAVMTQQTSVAFGFTVREVVAMGRAPWRGTDRAADDERIQAEAVALADVAHLLDRGVHGLSGGELARVAFARLLAQDTSVMLLDEPTAALDLRHQVGLLRCVRDRVRKGATAVIVVHDLTLAAAVADQVLLLDEGRVVALGAPGDVLVPDVLQQVYGVAVQVLADGRVVVPAAWV